MTDKITIYQAGPIQNVDDNGTGWRNRFVEDYPEYNWLNPLDKYNPSDVDDFENEGYGATDIENIVEGDKNMIINSDFVFVNYQDCRSNGTSMEILFSYDMDIPVIIWNHVNEPSPWVIYHSDYISTYETECIDYIEKLCNKKDLK
jgi:nucleoside 2-deoxyribosyltransferase